MSLLLLLAGSSSSAPAFDPSSLSNLNQRFLDEDPTYYGSTVNSYPILTPEESGAVAQPRAGRCALFDGSNDVAAGTMPVGSSLTFCCWLKAGSGTTQGIFQCNTGGVLLQYNGSTTMQWFPNTLTTLVSITIANISASWNHIAITQTGTTYALYINGSLVQTGTTVALLNQGDLVEIGRYTGNVLNGSIYDARVYSVAKSLAEIQAIYNQHLTPTTIDRTGLLGGWWLQEEAGTTGYDWSGNGKNLTYTNTTAATFHATDTGVKFSAADSLGHTVSGSVVIPRNEALPTLDAAGGALGVTAVAYPATMEVPCVTFDGVSSYATLGADFALKGEYCIAFWMKPTTTTGLQAILSNCGNGGVNLDYHIEINRNSGKIWAFADSSSGGVQSASAFVPDVWNHVAVTRSGTAGSWTFKIYLNGVLDATNSTSVNPNGSASSQLAIGRFGAYDYAFYSGGISDVRIFNVTKSLSEVQSIYSGLVDQTGLVLDLPLQEGPGGSNTNRTIYDVYGTNHLTLTNGTVATIWANRCPNARDHFIEYGGRVTSGVAIPGRLTGSLAADGNAKTHVAGKHGNPGSRLVPNVWNAPELYNIGYTSSIKLAPTDTVQSTSPADTKFRRTASDGDDRYFSTREALTSTNKTNAEAYVA